MALAASQSLRVLAWPRPKGLSLLQPIEYALKRLGEAWSTRAGGLYQELAAQVPLFREGGRAARTRRTRSDGMRNLIAFAQALLASCDLCSGFIGRPAAGGWDRFAWALMDARAYGPTVPNERSFRRSQRWIRALKSAGLVHVAEIRVPQADGSIRSHVAVKNLTAAFFKLVGLTAAVARARRERDRRRRAAAQVQVAGMIQAPQQQERAGKTSTVYAKRNEVAPHSGAPPPTKPQVATEVAQAWIAKIRETLGR